METAVVGLAERGVRSSVVRLPTIAHSTTDREGFLWQLIALAPRAPVTMSIGPLVHVDDVAGGKISSKIASPPSPGWPYNFTPVSSVTTRKNIS